MSSSGPIKKKPTIGTEVCMIGRLEVARFEMRFRSVVVAMVSQQ